MLSFSTRYIVVIPLLFITFSSTAQFGSAWIKDQVLQQLSESLGRQIEVVGELQLDLSWTPGLRAEQVRIANAQWSEQPYMAEFGALEASIDLSRLIKGQIVFPKLKLLAPKILLEVSAEHQANWHFNEQALPQAQQLAEQTLELALEEIEQTGLPPPPPDPAVPENLNLPLIQQLTIESGQLHYLNHATDIDVNASLDSASGKMNDQEIHFELQATLEQLPLTLMVQGDSVPALASATLYDLAIDIQAEDFSIGLAGELQQPLQLAGGELALEIEGSGMPALVNTWFGTELPQLPDYQLQATLLHTALTRWQIRDLSSQFGSSDLSGDAVLEMATTPPSINIELSSETFNIAELNAIAAGFGTEQPTSDQPIILDITPLRQWQGEVDLIIAELILTQDYTVQQIHAQGNLENAQLTLQPLQISLGQGSTQGELQLDASTDLLTGNAQLTLDNINLNEVLAKPEQDTAPMRLDGQVELRLADTETTAGQITLQNLIDQLRLDSSELHYQVPAEGTDLRLNAALTGSERNLQLTAQGTLQNQAVNIDIEGGPLEDLQTTDKPYAFSGQAEIGGVQGQVEGKILRTDTTWQLQDFSLGFGQSELKGETEWDFAAEQPVLRADFRAAKLNIAELSELLAKNGSSKAANPPQAIDLTALQNFDADIKLAVDQLQLPNLALTDAQMDIKLENGQLNINTLQASLFNQPINLSGQLDTSQSSATGQFVLDLGQLDLIALGTALDIEALEGTLAGQLTLTIVGQTPSKITTLAIPGLGRFQIEPSELQYTNPQLELEVTTTLSSYISQQNTQKIKLAATGNYQSHAFDLQARADSPLVLLYTNQPYAIDTELNIRETTLQAAGSLAQPLDVNQLNLSVAVSGPDPSVLKPLLDIPLPELPPYQIEGQLKREGEKIEFNDFSGTVGDSDLAGDVLVQLDTQPLTLYATLYSRRIDLDDLAGLIGGTPAADAGETASAEQRQEQAERQKSPYLLPQEPLNLHQTSQLFNGVIKFTGQRLQTSKLPFDELAFELKFEQGNVALEPLSFSIGSGKVQSNIQLNAQQQPTAGTIESEVYRVNLKELLAPFEIADDSLGIIGGQAKLWVQGDSVAEWFASADGGLFLLMTQGRLDVLLTELAGLDISESLVALAGEVESIPIDCAYIDAHSENGILELATTVIDTSDTLFLADGFVDFNQELIGIRVEPHPKDVSLFSLRSPLHIEGRLKAPSVYPGASGIITRGAAAAALAAATPLASLLPFIELPTGEDTVYCDGLISALDNAR